MGLTAFQRRFSAWLALLALVLGGLSPALTQALTAGTERAGWVQICTASGMSWVQIDAQTSNASDASDVSDAASGGCTWCQHHGAAGLPPPVFMPPLALGPLVEAAPRPQTVALAPWWPPALGRAPPAHA